jgi:hypothetical protein
MNVIKAKRCDETPKGCLFKIRHLLPYISLAAQNSKKNIFCYFFTSGWYDYKEEP